MGEQLRPHSRSSIIVNSSLLAKGAHISSVDGGSPKPPSRSDVERCLALARRSWRCLWPGPPWGNPAQGRIAVLVSVAQDANSENREYMEDGYAVADPLLEDKDMWSYFAVFDGHGGRDEVDYCQVHFHNVIAEELLQREDSDHEATRIALGTAFTKIDMSLKKTGAFKSGCTATVVLAHRSNDGRITLFVANVGDSRALLLGDGRARRASTDHRAREHAEAERVRLNGGFVVNGRVGGALCLSRALGDHDLKPGVSCEPDISIHDVDGARILIIASDGLWDYVAEDEVQEIVENSVGRAAGGSPSGDVSVFRTTACLLVDRAKERGSRDNLLVLVLFF